MSSLATALSIALTLTAQPRPPEPPPRGPPPLDRRPERIVLSGTVRESRGLLGSTVAALVREDGTTAVLHHPDPAFEGELKRLQGARVRIEGVRMESGPSREDDVMVDRYEILEVGPGIRPRIGLIASLDLDGKSRLIFVGEDGIAALLPEGWATKLRAHVGAKIWIVADTTNHRFAPSRFAILRPGSQARPPAPNPSPQERPSIERRPDEP